MVSYFIVGDMNHSLPRNHPENQDLPGESEQVGVNHMRTMEQPHAILPHVILPSVIHMCYYHMLFFRKKGL
jgi:hypothetical protein